MCRNGGRVSYASSNYFPTYPFLPFFVKCKKHNAPPVYHMAVLPLLLIDVTMVASLSIYSSAKKGLKTSIQCTV